MVLIQTGFITGNDFLVLSEAGKRGYMMGLTDGLFIFPLVGADEIKQALRAG